MSLKTIFDKEIVKNLGVVVTLLSFLLGAVSFGIAKVNQWDAYGQRISQLESRDQSASAIASTMHDAALERQMLRTDLTQTIKNVDALSQTMIDVRLKVERLNALMERTK